MLSEHYSRIAEPNSMNKLHGIPISDYTSKAQFSRHYSHSITHAVLDFGKKLQFTIYMNFVNVK